MSENEKNVNQQKNAAQEKPEPDFNELVRIRREKLENLKAAGKDPFEITKFDVENTAKDIIDNFKDKDEGDETPNDIVVIAGRIMTKRGMGKAGFADLRDETGRIQLYVRKDMIGDESYDEFKKFDIGDIVGVKGETFRTHMGEISVKAHEIVLLAKSLLPLPDKWSGLKDQDTRYRQRYVDLIVNPDVRDTFVKRSLVMREIRAYLDAKGFLEVDTPVLTPFEIGAAARPFVTHHNTLDMDMYLRIETELYLKRLVVGGMNRVYEVGRIFRNEGMSPKHNPEFTTVELYQAFTDYKGMMALVEELNCLLAEKVCGTHIINYQGTEIDMSHWERLTMVEA
ncbi:MAG: amino acid--tRNA ligase-related protein, partial [Oscillospiraceae bacterium]